MVKKKKKKEKVRFIYFAFFNLKFDIIKLSGHPD